MASFSEGAGNGDSKQPNLSMASIMKAASQIPWDPMTSSDWDNEKHTPEAIIRIKRYAPCN